MALELTIPGGATQLSGNRVQASIATTLKQGSFYRILCKTTSVDNSFPEGIDPIEPTDLTSVFDLRNRVSMPVDYDFSWPLTGNVFIKRAQLAKKVMVDIGESFIDGSGNKIINWAGLTENNTLLILKGKLSKHEQAKYNELGKTFYQEYIEAGRFLTMLPVNQRISPAQPVKLWFITKEVAPQIVNLKVDFMKLDGTSGSILIPGTIDPDAIYEICTDCGSLGLAATEINYYSVAIDKDGIAVSETRTFTIDHFPYEINNYMFCSNRVGAIDSFWFHGHVKTYFPTESESSQRNAQITDTQKKATIEVDWKDGVRKWEINSGYRSVEEQQALKSLLESTDIWMIDGNDIIPVMLEDGDNQLGYTLEDTQYIELTFKEAH